MTHPPHGDDERDRRPGEDARPPAPPYGQPQYGPPGQYGQPGQHGPPQYGPPGQYGPPRYGPQQYGPPGQYGPPQYGPPQYGPPGQYGQSPYGQPQFAQGGWEEPQPPRRSRRPPFLLGLLVLAVVIGVVLMLPGTRSTALDPQAVQRDVAEQFQQREGVAVDLRCGDDMTVQAGRSYECSGTTADGEPVTITIAITDDDANYTWSEG